VLEVGTKVDGCGGPTNKRLVLSFSEELPILSPGKYSFRAVGEGPGKSFPTESKIGLARDAWRGLLSGSVRSG